MSRIQGVEPKCATCNSPLHISSFKRSIKYRCEECGHLTKIDHKGHCIKHPYMKAIEVFQPEYKKYYCKVCQTYTDKFGKPKKSKKLEKRLKVDRKLSQLIAGKKELSKHQFFKRLVNHLLTFNGEDVIYLSKYLKASVVRLNVRKRLHFLIF